MILWFIFSFFLKSSRPSLLIRRAALGNLKASFHCTHWHRFFPLKKAPPLISIFSPQARRRKPPCSVLFFRFPPSPFSQRELHLQPSLLNSLYDPFGSPCRGQKPQKEGCKPPNSVLGTAAL